MILGLDPSYTGFGVALMDDSGSIILHKKLKSDLPVYDDITNPHKASQHFLQELKDIIKDYEVDVVIEYPALRTVSGAYLAILNGALAIGLDTPQVKSITWVPPTAVDSFSKNREHSKSYLVEFCKTNGWIDKRTSHDECTAIILCKLLVAINTGAYKNSYFKR